MTYLLYATACLLVLETVFLSFLLVPLPVFFVNLVLSVMQLARIPFRMILVLLSVLTFIQTQEMWKAEEKVSNLPANTPFDKESVLLTRKFREERNFYLYAFTTCVLIVLLRLEIIIRQIQELKSKQKTS